jgi:hypothetical protein
LPYVKRHDGVDVEQQYYRKRALDCLAAAETVREPGERVRLVHIAQLFLRLSMHVRSRLESGRPAPAGYAAIDQGMQDAT